MMGEDQIRPAHSIRASFGSFSEQHQSIRIPPLRQDASRRILFERSFSSSPMLAIVLVLLIQLLLVPGIHALGILLPLYIYPGADCAAWSPVFQAISANSNAQWYIIVNPDSGPGPTDPLYQGCVSQVPASSNQITMGFIDTKGGNVLGDIDTYAGWPTSARPHGIFFINILPTTSMLSTYQSYISHAKSQGFTFIGLDGGETVSEASYFSIADLINTYEDTYSSFNANSLTGTISKQSVILVNSPTTGSYNNVISELESKGVAAVYISTVSDGNSTLPVQLSEFASEVASASLGGGALSSVNPQAATHTGPPITAIVGGAVGGLIILLVLLISFLCMRSRRRNQLASLEAVVPFTEVRNPKRIVPAAPLTEGSSTSEVAPSQFWNRDIKVPVPVESTSRDNPTVAADLSVRVAYPTTAQISNARIYGSAWESLSASGPPPSYHHSIR